MIVGTAEVLVHANTSMMLPEVEKGSRAAFAEVEREAKVAGERSGAALASGVRTGTAAMAAETRAAGVAVGAGLSKPVETGAKRSEAALVGASAVGKKAMFGLGAAIVVATGEGVHLAASLESSEAAIASASRTTIAQADKIGQALLGTAGKSEFSAEQQAKAFATVAGQLKEVQGRALDAGEAEKFMAAAGDLAIAKNIDLGASVSAVATILQGFHMDVSEAAHVSDVLYSASTATGVGVDTLGSQIARLRSRLGDTAGSLTDVTSLLVDMTERGITGRTAMSAVSSGLGTLQKQAGGVTAAMHSQETAFAALPPKLKVLAKGYQDGEISSKNYHKVVSSLPVTEQNAMAAFNRAATSVSNAAMKYRSLGIEVFSSNGKFVGMSKIIDQLNPRFAKMTQQQQIAMATTLFGAGAARQMVAVINAGPAAYDKATAAVNRHGAAEGAAKKQSSTLHGQVKVLGAEFKDIVTVVGEHVIPVFVSVGHTLLSATHFVLDHKAAAIALAVVIGGPLSIAVGAFTVNKLARMVTSVKGAGAELRVFAATASGVGKRVAASFGLQSDAAAANAARIEAAQAAETTAVTSTATTVQAENSATSRSFTMVGTSTVASATTVDTAMATEATAVAAADTTIEAENTAAAASFTAMLGPIAAVAAAAAGAYLLVRQLSGQSLNATGTVKGTPILGSTQDQINYANQVGHKLLAGANSPFNWNNFLHSTPTVPVGSALGGLTPTQKKQLASLEAGAGGSARIGGGGGGGGGTSGSKTAGGATWQQIAQALSGMGLSDVQIAGALGNFGAEAGGMTVKGISTTARNPTSGAYGFAQWLGPRLTALQHYAKSQGLPASSLKAQIGFLEKELRGTEHGTLGALKGASTPAQAAQIFEHAFERGSVSSGNMAQRQKLAAQALGMLTGSKSVKVPLYANPFAGATGLHVGQTDMGVDYSMTPGSKIGAIGAGTVVGIKQNWYKGQPYIAYKLTQGPRKGQVVYVAEQIKSQVRVGEHLAAGQTIGTYAATGTGIEMGLADPHNWRQTLAQAHGHGAYGVRHASGGTIEGQQFSAMLRSIGSGVSQTVSATGAVSGAPKLSPQEKHLVAVEKTVVGQQNVFNKWLASQRATESIMSAQQKRALNEEIAIKRSALGIQTANEYASVLTLTKQQRHALSQQTSDQKLGSVVMTKLVAAAHEKNLAKLEPTIARINQAGFAQLVKRLEHSHVAGFSALAKRLISVHKTAMDHLAAETIAEQKKIDAKVAAAASAAWAAVIGYSAMIDKDKADAQVQAIQDATKVALDQQAEVGKTGADLVATQAHTHLDQVTQTQNALIAVAQQSYDVAVNAPGATEIEKAQAAAALQKAQSDAAIAEAQAQATADLDDAAANTADAAKSAADAAASSADAANALAPDKRNPAIPANITFEINGAGMSASELFAEIGWTLKTGALPLPAAA